MAVISSEASIVFLLTDNFQKNLQSWPSHRYKNEYMLKKLCLYDRKKSDSCYDQSKGKVKTADSCRVKECWHESQLETKLIFLWVVGEKQLGEQRENEVN